MSNKEKDFSLPGLAKKFEFFKTLDWYKFYEELNKSCTEKENTDSCDGISFSELKGYELTSLLKKLFCNLKCTLKPQELFANELAKLKDKHCIYIKYWLYDTILTSNFQNSEIESIFGFLEKHKNNGIIDESSEKPCNFYKLSIKDIEDIRNIYAYAEIFHKTETDNYGKISKDREYLNYFKKGFDLYKKSKIKCAIGNDEYCKEFNEYKDIYDKYGKESAFLSCQERFLSSLYDKDEIALGESLQEGIHYIIKAENDISCTSNRTCSKNNMGVNLFFIIYEMPSDTLDPNLKKLLDTDNTVEELSLHKYYEFLTSLYNGHTSISCDSLENKPIKEKNIICKLWESVKKILMSWNKDHSSYGNLASNKLCDYFNYWLYYKLRYIKAPPCDIDMFYFLWNDFASQQTGNKKTCYNKNYYVYNKVQLENKKKLFDFLEYYDKIKAKLNKALDNNRTSYCYYIKIIFDLYKTMVHKNDSQVYTEELWLFRKKFWDNGELHFLEEKCPNMCLGLVFNVKNKTLCPLDEKPSIETEEEDLKLCDTAESYSSLKDPRGNHERVYGFHELPTYNIYKELNSEVIVDNYYNICSKLLRFSSNYCGIYGLCIKLARNLKELSTMTNKERDNRCEYITHWLYDKIWTVLNIDTNSIYDTEVLKEIFKVGYVILHKLDISDCHYNVINVNFVEQKEKKYLHDFFKNYMKIISDNSSNSGKREIYCEYVTFINELYRKYISKCCYCFKNSDCSEDCPDYFKCGNKYNPYDIFEKLKCKDIAKFHGGLERVYTPLPVDHHVILLTENSKKKKEKPLLTLDEKETPIIPEKACNKITCDPFYVASFTPLGSYFQNSGARKKRSHFQKHELQFLEDDIEFKHENMKNSRVCLAYHQA
ncbi:PIR Superfamily Protein [Plasmodium ovale wallikeri]|uniref:PIR Superfamily Protein n=1 Tax=Plasmodium ovale wallikeri TaxID=864142 RepID=A0A1A9APY8_PLAOA|nr:PIR Superfamily Protein [Plasmodium ovale wallikeri]SBT58166.1 PIR Superfamily Protein [Plasmodium ovale wallikeri]